MFVKYSSTRHQWRAGKPVEVYLPAIATILPLYSTLKMVYARLQFKDHVMIFCC